MTDGPPPGNGYPPPSGPGQPPGGQGPGGYQTGGYQPGGYQPPQQPGYQSAYGTPGGQSAPKAGLIAPSSSNPILKFTGITLAVAGLLMVVFSFFSWAADDNDVFSVSVSGMGSVSLDGGAEGASSAELEQLLEDSSKSPGIFTLILGVLIIAVAVLLIINKFPGVGAIVATVVGLLATIMALVYLFAPADAVLGDAGDSGIGDAGFGLWLVTIGAVVALIAGALSIVLALKSPTGPPAGLGTPVYGPPQGQPGQPHGQQPGQGYGPPRGYGQQ